MTPSDPSIQQPASRRIAEELRRRIRDGEIPAGEKLPSERALA
ncbi:GntR family transcriptional regulator, partial [Streptomyces albidoflavus]